ncbi:MAG: alanine--tRNA ligase [Rhodospirillales bacterium]|nr:alanine--tRNA ligase [Rhodospirillales bacterium]
MQSTNDIRAAFMSFFKDAGHEVVSSSPLVPENDPTLLFTNAGMVQFKNLFVGAETRDYSRAVTSQKCVRAGGKHNDLENVGYTARHHTFFEMLGNFSFGDYFKEGAIEFCWNLMTREFGLDKDRLLVTVYADDEEAHGLWQKIAGISDERIIRIATSDNFWSMGETGPCGPCSEIFYDHGDHIPGGPPGSADEDGDRFIEIWNLVFMQFEQVSTEKRIDLPKPSIDTGMGLERITAVLQGVHDNYDIDLFQNLIQASADAAGTAPDGEHAVSHRVIADHLRAASFLIADGVLPANDGRGYVVRRIMRRAMRHAHLMGCTDPLLHKLVPALTREMGRAFPELSRAEALITETLELEETRFKRTLDRGLKLLADETDNLSAGGVLAGEVAFKLYDTFGFPLDLTEDALRGKGMSVDLAGFNKEMERQRDDARKAWAGSGQAATEQVWFEIREQAGPTEFLGYETEKAEGQVVAIVVDGESVDQAAAGAAAAIIVNQTPFYGESGGQQGDTGAGWTDQGARIAITETQKKLGDLHIHLGKVSGGAITVGEAIHLAVDGARRAGLRAHHSATHLLHAALHRQLGDHVAQKGSLVASDRLRFDISHQKPVAPDEISAIEAAVNAQVRANTSVTTRLMTPDEAIEAGATALFGEKYGAEVRVVGMGADGNQAYSTELCGGTHVARTGDIGAVRIIGESAVAAGVRRIEAVTGAAAETLAAAEAETLSKAAALLKVHPSEVAVRIEKLLLERRQMEQELADTRRQMATGGSAGNTGGNGGDIVQVNGINYLGKILDAIPAKELKTLADDLKGQVGSGVVALITVNEGKASLVVGVTDDMTASLSAVDLVKAGSEALGGKGGGGRPDMAQAGGPGGDKAKAALDAIKEMLK